jgi:hypothetical protein
MIMRDHVVMIRYRSRADKGNVSKEMQAHIGVTTICMRAKASDRTAAPAII